LPSLCASRHIVTPLISLSFETNTFTAVFCTTLVALYLSSEASYQAFPVLLLPVCASDLARVHPLISQTSPRCSSP